MLGSTSMRDFLPDTHTEMEFEINISKVLQFISVQKYKKLIYKHGTNVMNQSSHKWYLMKHTLTVNDKEPPVVTKSLGLASKERAGEKACLLAIQQERQARIAHTYPGVKIIFL